MSFFSDARLLTQIFELQFREIILREVPKVCSECLRIRSRFIGLYFMMVFEPPFHRFLIASFSLEPKVAEISRKIGVRVSQQKRPV